LRRGKAANSSWGNITAENDGIWRDYAIALAGAIETTRLRASPWPGPTRRGRETDAERLAAHKKALTGRGPKVYSVKDGEIMVECYEGRLEGFRRYAELADAIERWLEEVGR